MFGKSDSQACSGDRSVKIERALEKENKLLTLKLKYLTKGGVMLKREHNFIGNIFFPSLKLQPSKTEETAGLLL